MEVSSLKQPIAPKNAGVSKSGLSKLPGGEKY